MEIWVPYSRSCPPQLCVANQPVGHVELFMLKAVSNTPGKAGFRHAPLTLWAEPQHPLVLLGQNPRGHKDKLEGTLCRASRVSRGPKAGNPGTGGCLAPHSVLCDLSIPLPLSGRYWNSQGQVRLGAGKSLRRANGPDLLFEEMQDYQPPDSPPQTLELSDWPHSEPGLA